MDNDFGYQSMLKCLLLIIYRCKIDNKTKTWRTCHWSFKYILNVKCLLTAFSKLNNEILSSVFKQHERCLSIYKNFKHLRFHDWDLLKTWVFTCVSESPCDYVYSTWESSCFFLHGITQYYTFALFSAQGDMSVTFQNDTKTRHTIRQKASRCCHFILPLVPDLAWSHYHYALGIPVSKAQIESNKADALC